MAKAPRQRAPGPSAAQCRQVVEALASLHGQPKRPRAANGKDSPLAACGESGSVLEALIRTILSQNTTNKSSNAAMAGLLATFGRDWAALRRATPAAIAKSIVVGGLSNIKGKRIHRLVNDVHDRFGEASLESLRDASNEEAMRVLLDIEGVGLKTASCVLLFCLRRDRFAVDTHVLRISKKLGWVPATCTLDEAHRVLEQAVPDSLKYPLHVLMVSHGKCCVDCAANHRPQFAPKGPCPLRFPAQRASAARPRAAKKRASRSQESSWNTGAP